MVKLEYQEIDGLLYPKLEIDGSQRLKQLDKFGRARLEFLHDKREELYRELLISGQLADHCEQVAEQAFEKSEQVQERYVEMYGVAMSDFAECVVIRMRAQMLGDEIAMNEVVFQ